MTGKRRIFNIAAKEEHQLLLDCVGFDIDFLLLLDEFRQLADDLVRDIFHVLAAPWGVNSIDEGHVGEFVGGREANDILPAGVRALIDALHGSAALHRSFRADIQVNILLEMTHGNERAIVFDFHGFVGHCCDIVSSFQEQGDHIRGEVIASEPESGVIGAEADAGIRLDLGLCDDWRHDFREIVPEFLAVFQTANMVDGLHATPNRPDENEFEPEPVLPANDFLFLVLVVVGRRAKMPENHFRNPEFMLRMLGDVDAVTVVGHMNRPVDGVNFYFEGGDRECVGFAIGDGLGLTHDMVAHIDHTFIEEFVEAGDVSDVAAGQQGGSGGGGV